MKIIITENKLRDLQLQYLNRSIGSTSDFENFIIIHYPNDYIDNEYESDIMMEYDSDDGRLYIDNSFLDNFGKVYFPNEDDAGPFIKDWFEHQYGVEINFLVS
jgi:hypothetical protein